MSSKAAQAIFDSEGENTEENVNASLKLGVFDIWALGISIVIGGQYFCFNLGLLAGFGSYCIATFLLGTSYIMLCFCNAEITSMLPFAGGAYGLARVSLGLYWGFMVGICEAVEYIVYVSSTSVSLSNMILSISGSDPNLMPVLALIFYLTALAIHIKGGLLFWRTNAFLALVSLAFVLIYGLGSLPWVDFGTWAKSPTTNGSEEGMFLGGMEAFMTAYPLAAWFYVGVESLNLGCAYVSNPKVQIGRGSVACVLTLFATSILVLFVVSSLPPMPSTDDAASPLDFLTNSVAESLNPFNSGYQRMFKISFASATILSIPATYATAFGFVFSYGRLLLAMSRSGLFPTFMARTYGPYKTPYVTFIVGSVIGYALVIAVHYEPVVALYLFNICMISAFFAYSSQMLGYILLKVRFPNQERLYKSPFGIPGAVYAMLNFVLGFVSIVAFQHDDCTAFIVWVICVDIYTAYYFLWAKRRQTFSPEEQFIYVQQIVQFNERQRKMATKGVLKRQKKPAWLVMSEQASARLGLLGKDNKISVRESEHSESCRPSIRSSHTKSEHSVSARGPALQPSASTRIKVFADSGEDEKTKAAQAAAAAAAEAAAAVAADVAESGTSREDEKSGKEDDYLLPLEQTGAGAGAGSSALCVKQTPHRASLLQPLEPVAGLGSLQSLDQPPLSASVRHPLELTGADRGDSGDKKLLHTGGL